MENKCQKQQQKPNTQHCKAAPKIFPWSSLQHFCPHTVLEIAAHRQVSVWPCGIAWCSTTWVWVCKCIWSRDTLVSYSMCVTAWFPGGYANVCLCLASYILDLPKWQQLRNSKSHSRCTLHWRRERSPPTHRSSKPIPGGVWSRSYFVCLTSQTISVFSQYWEPHSGTQLCDLSFFLWHV